MNIKLVLTCLLLIAATACGVLLVPDQGELLFDTIWWGPVAASVVGFIAGLVRGRVKGKEKIVDGKAIRHGVGSFITHWGVAFGIFLLIASGVLIGFLFISPPATVNETIYPINMHYAGVVIMLFSGFFFVGDFISAGRAKEFIPTVDEVVYGFIGKYMLRRKYRTPEGKYLASQKVAFLGWAALIIVMVITGAIKMAGHFIVMHPDVLGWSTLIHDIFTILVMAMLLIHVLIVIAMPENWPTIPSWLTGKVPAHFAREHHPLWYAQLASTSKEAKSNESGKGEAFDEE